MVNEVNADVILGQQIVIPLAMYEELLKKAVLFDAYKKKLLKEFEKNCFITDLQQVIFSIPDTPQTEKEVK